MKSTTNNKQKTVKVLPLPLLLLSLVLIVAGLVVIAMGLTRGIYFENTPNALAGAESLKHYGIIGGAIVLVGIIVLLSVHSFNSKRDY